METLKFSLSRAKTCRYTQRLEAALFLSRQTCYPTASAQEMQADSFSPQAR